MIKISLKSLNISRPGGKFRTIKILKKITPFHDSFLSLFCGACWYEINKPRARFEVFNDKDSELINYLLVIRDHPKEFDELKKGVFSLVSKEIFERMSDLRLKPKDNLERAYFFYYLNKWAFGGSIRKMYRGITLKGSAPNYAGISYKLTRPHTNNDKGLMSPLDPKSIKRLQYVNITNYNFEKCYDLFARALLKKKPLQKDPNEILIFADPPYPSTESYYNASFCEEDHLKLINILDNTPFNFILTIGMECDIYLKKLDHHYILPIKVVYSTSANNQYERQEYIIMNYNYKKVPRMILSNNKLITDYKTS